MRSPSFVCLFSALALVAAGCTSQSPVRDGPPGPQGPTGPQGIPGPTGPAGGGSVAGSLTMTPIAPGEECASGGLRLTLDDGGTSTICNGGPGPMGATGATGPTGPAGSGGGLALTQLDGGTACPYGGVSVATSGGPTLFICNGTPGAQGVPGATGVTGAQGPMGIAGPAGATGPQGSQGVQGPAGPAGPTGATGVSVTATPLPNGSTQCPYGGTKFDLGATTTYACNGAPGGVGPPGQSAVGDGGVPIASGAGQAFTFAGFTSASYTGSMGGIVGAHAKCHAEFPGAHLCTGREYSWIGSGTAVPSAGAWIDDDYGTSSNSPNIWPRDRYVNGYNCVNFTSNQAIDYGMYLTTDGLATVAQNYCTMARPLACCRSQVATFRGFTTASFTGSMGSVVGINAKCQAQFPGAHVCTAREYEWAGSPTAIPSVGAWIDDDYGTSSNSPNTWPRDRYQNGYNCDNWRSAAAIDYGMYLQTTGLVTVAQNYCTAARPIACCGP